MILAVVLKRVALTNNSEFGYPTFFSAPTPVPSIPNEGGSTVEYIEIFSPLLSSFLRRLIYIIAQDPR